MVVPLPFAPLVGLALGALLAWLGRAEPPGRSATAAGAPSDALAAQEAVSIAGVATSRPLALVLAYAACVYAPIVGYFVAFHGDWAYLYFVPWRAVPSALDLALVLVSAATVPLGFVAAGRAARAKRLGTVGLVGGVPAALVLALVVALQRRLATSATYVQFHGGFGTEPITASLLGPAVLWMGLVGTAGALWCAYQLKPGVVSRSTPARAAKPREAARAPASQRAGAARVK